MSLCVGSVLIRTFLIVFNPSKLDVESFKTYPASCHTERETLDLFIELDLRLVLTFTLVTTYLQKA